MAWLLPAGPGSGENEVRPLLDAGSGGAFGRERGNWGHREGGELAPPGCCSRSLRGLEAFPGRGALGEKSRECKTPPDWTQSQSLKRWSH